MLEEDDSSTINGRLPEPLARTAREPDFSATAAQSGKSTGASDDTRKSQQNSAILQTSLEVSIQSKNQPLALLLKSAIASINDLLEPQFGENAIQAAAKDDNTPAGTAGRIVSLSTGFFAAFKQQHPGEDAAGVLADFMATIRRGFEQGAKEAQGILEGMGVLDGDIASNIDKTLELVRQGYADFEAAQRGSLQGMTP